MQFQWSYLQRVVPDCNSCFEVLRNALSDIFWPAVLQGTISDSEKKLFTLPARLGGMGIHDPLLTVASFTNSRKCTALIVDAIKCSSVFSVLDHTEHKGGSRGGAGGAITPPFPWNTPLFLFNHASSGIR